MRVSAQPSRCFPRSRTTPPTFPLGEGAVATRGGEVVAYLIASLRTDRAEIGLAGVAASEPEAVRDLYAHRARTWPPNPTEAEMLGHLRNGLLRDTSVTCASARKLDAA